MGLLDPALLDQMQQSGLLNTPPQPKQNIYTLMSGDWTMPPVRSYNGRTNIYTALGLAKGQSPDTSLLDTIKQNYPNLYQYGSDVLSGKVLMGTSPYSMGQGLLGLMPGAQPDIQTQFDGLLTQVPNIPLIFNMYKGISKK